MMILKRKNPNAHRENALQFTESDGICCEDGSNAVVCRYKATIDTGTVTSLSKISIGGTEYNFATAVATGTAEGARKIKESIEGVLYQLGYTSHGIGVTLLGTDLIVETSLSLVAFDYLEVAGNAFDKLACRSIGDYKATGSNDDTDVGAYYDDGDAVVTIGATKTIKSVAVTGTGVTAYDGPASGGVVRTPVTLAADASVELTVVVTYADDTTSSHTVTIVNRG